MYNIFVKLGAYFLLILIFLLYVPFNIGRISLKKIREYLSDVGYKADEILEDWGHSDEK